MGMDVHMCMNMHVPTRQRISHLHRCNMRLFSGAYSVMVIMSEFSSVCLTVSVSLSPCICMCCVHAGVWMSKCRSEVEVRSLPSVIRLHLIFGYRVPPLSLKLANFG